MYRSKKRHSTGLAVFLTASLLISGCATSTAPTSPSIQNAFLRNFDLVGKEKILYQDGVIDINCYRCRNGTLILTDKGIYIFAQKKYIQPLTPKDFTEDNLYLMVPYSNVVDLEKPEGLSGFFGHMKLSLKDVYPNSVYFVVGGTAGGNKPYKLIKNKMDEEIDALRQAALQGDQEAQYELGYRYLSWGIKELSDDDEITTANPSIDEAVRWLRMAGEQGNVDASQKLGDIYLQGIYVWKDVKEATKWYSIASNLGDDYSVRKLETIKQDYPVIWEQVTGQ